MKLSDVRPGELSAVAKGLATYLAPLNWYRKRRMSGGSTMDSAYCYSVWMRHVCTMRRFGWHPAGKRVCELGPGNSIGVGIAALLSGVCSYTGLDAFPYPFAADKECVAALVRDLSQLYSRMCSIPGPDRYPEIRPNLEEYVFPRWLLATPDPAGQVARITAELIRDAESNFSSKRLTYLAPYENRELSEHASSFDAVFSQAALEHVRDLASTYRIVFNLLKPKGWSWHIVDFRCHGLASEWNGHWTYPDWLWKIVVGRREFLLNRLPLTKHIEFATQAGFKVQAVSRYREGDHPSLVRESALTPNSFAPPFKDLSREDASTVGAMLVLQRP